ncbi:hypothetical protein [Methylibium rhizosphaerae]|uniref:hypothetical protein n=1 Tax=Methylibium rhizosphaerae TaxID=2570323 RepID=UPI00112E12AA|nr:hypothetical protein [Methylibium rhizosphaerae]
MTTRLRATGLGLLLCVLASAQGAGAATAASGVEAAAAPEAAAKPVDPVKAAERCEDAVADTVRTIRGREAREIEFAGGKRTLQPGEGDEMAVKGAGRYRASAGGTVPFSYTCTYNAKTGATTGAMFRETGPRPGDVTSDQPWQPDLTNVSPEACEAATAAALKDKYPRVGRIAFGSDTRRLQPAPNERIGLEGQGALQRAPGMNAAPFKYRCEFEPRSGKIVKVTTSD